MNLEPRTEAVNLYAVVGVNTDEHEILSLADNYKAALDAARREMDSNEDWCLIKIERIV